MNRNLRSRTAAAVAAAAMGLALIAITGPPASAGGDHGGHDDDVVTVATGLNNPRQLSVGNGHRLYVAEAGTADDCEAVPNAEGLATCGLTGSVTEVSRHGQERVVTELPALQFGEEVIGASDVHVRWDRITVLTGGMGPGASARDGLDDQYATFGTLRSGRLHHAPLTGDDLRLVADLNAYEVANNPDGNDPPDSNAVGMAALGDGRWAVTDAGGNTLLRVSRHNERTVAVFPNGPAVPNPTPEGPREINPQAVPTDVAVGPDGAYYVSQLTGFPFPAGGSTIWRVTRDGAISAYATGLSTVTSLAWKHGTLYAVQIDDGTFLDGQNVGSLREITPGGSTHEAVVDGLSSPYGLAIRGHSAYVTVDSVSSGEGSVIRVDLH